MSRLQLISNTKTIPPVAGGAMGPSGAVSYAEGLGAQDLQLQAQIRGSHPGSQ